MHTSRGSVENIYIFGGWGGGDFTLCYPLNYERCVRETSFLILMMMMTTTMKETMAKMTTTTKATTTDTRTAKTITADSLISAIKRTN